MLKVKKFHQFIVLEKGPVNTAIIDLLKGDVYQIGNDIADKFLAGNHVEIPGFVRMAEQEKLCIDVDAGDWIPYITFEQMKDDSFHVQIEEETDLDAIRKLFRDYPVTVSVLTRDERDFERCKASTKCRGNFNKIDENSYHFNRYYNSCWGKRITVLKDGAVKPCFHSRIVFGNIFVDDMGMMIDQAIECWKLNKDKVEKCKDCELRYVCFDCREIAMREGQRITSGNPYCGYDPYTGIWEWGDMDSR